MHTRLNILWRAMKLKQQGDRSPQFVRSNRPGGPLSARKSSLSSRRPAYRPRTRGSPMRNLVLQLLSRVTHFEHKKSGLKISTLAAAKLPRDEIRSAGLPYFTILMILRRRIPRSTATQGTLRVIAHFARTQIPGFENCDLPQVRPHGTRREVRRISRANFNCRTTYNAGGRKPRTTRQRIHRP